MHIQGTQPNKFEIFQEFYYIYKGVELSYNKAVELFFQMDNEMHTEFCKYYQDKVDYVVDWSFKTDDSGDFLLGDDGEVIISNPPYTNVRGYDIKSIMPSELKVAKNSDGTDKTKKKKIREKQPDGSYKYLKNSDGTFQYKEVKVYESALADLNQAYINQKYTIQAYAAKNGLVLDPVWSQYSPEEILQMENEGVNIPQDILDIAHTILEGAGENYEGGEDDEGAGEKTTERESFLELIPKAEKHIEKCEDKREKIDDKIDDLLEDNKKSQKSIFSKQKEQLEELKEYEAKIREWRHLQDKINNGEELTNSEAKKYAEITGMLQDRNFKSEDFGINKNKIAFSLNEINILAVLGEKLADETIEISDELTDYLSQDNYKRTRSAVMGEVGILRGIVAMANGKAVAKEANIIGNDTKEYTDEVSGTINDIAGVLGVENMIANPGAADATDTTEPTEVKQAENETATEGPKKEEIKTTDEDRPTEKESAREKNTTLEDDFIINDKNVLGLIKEAGEINIDLLKEIKDALLALKMAKDDKNFAERASKIIDKLVGEYQQEEQERQNQIQTKEQENKDAQKRIDELKGENSEDNKNKAESLGFKTDDKNNKNSEEEKEIEEKQNIIEKNNNDIESIKAESEAAKETFKQRIQGPKNVIAKAIPEEMKALEKDSKYRDEIIPEDIERLDFTDNSGGTLYKMGKYRITVGLEYLAAGWFIPPLRIIGLYHIAKGTISAGIGATAKYVSKIPTPKAANKAVKASTESETQAIEDLNEVDVMISSVTGEQTEMEKAEATQENEENTDDTVTEENGENSANVEDNGEGGANGKNPANQEPTTVNLTRATTTVQAAVSAAALATAEPTDDAKTEEPKVDEKAPAEPETEPTEEEKPQEAPDKDLADGAEEPKPDEEDDANTGSSKKEEKQDPKSAGSSVTSIKGDAKATAKDSEKVKKDTEKDEKQLEKETKRLTKQMQQDEQKIIKMTKESLRAAKKQEEILVRYEELVTENDKIAAEEESKKNSAPAPVVQQNQQNSQGVAMAVAGGATVTDSSKSSTADNQAKMDANNQEITVLGGQFKVCGKKIDRNRTKIIKLQKSTKTNLKKFNKKNKIRETKINEANKKEEEKQKRLAKQLATVGIAENVFSITMATGMILAAFVVTAEVGAAMIAVGKYGLVLCGLTKAGINFANGNTTAALMALAQTAITVATSGAGGSSVAGNVMAKVSAGLSIVSSSAELVNNVRVVQGKEASGAMSKISAVAGVASAVTGAASTLGKSTSIVKDGAGNLVKQTTQGAFKSASNLGKTMQILSMTGQALSSANQLMSEFGWGDEKTRNMLGTIGSAVSMAASVGQIAESAQKNASERNKEANDKVESTNNKDENKEVKTKEQKKADKAQQKEQKKAEKAQKKSDKKAEKQAKKDLKAEKKEEQKAEKAKEKEQKKNEKAQKDDNKQPAVQTNNVQSTQAQVSQAQPNQPAPEAAIAAANQANTNSDKIKAMENNNNANTTAVDDSANDNTVQGKNADNKKNPEAKKDLTKQSPDDATVKMDIKEIEAMNIAQNESMKLNDANIEASMSELTEKINTDTASNSNKSKEQELELAEQEKLQKQKESKELTENDLTVTNDKGEKVRATHEDGTEVTLAEARANMTVNGASKEFATMDNKMLDSEIKTLDAELKPAPADQNNNGNQQQNSNTSQETPEQKAEKQAKQEKLEKLKKEQENRKAYQERQEKLQTYNNEQKSKTWEKAGEVVGKLTEGITEGAKLFAQNDEEEEQKKNYVPTGLDARVKRYIKLHEGFINNGTTSQANQENYLATVKKQPKRINMLAGRQELV